jgi:hypothetical protein
MTEGIMTKESRLSLIAAAALFGMTTLSIAGACNGWVAFNDQPDAMVTQLYTSDFGAGHQVASNVAPSDWRR